MQAEDRAAHKNPRQGKRSKRKVATSVKPADEKLAEKGLLKLIKDLSEEVKVPAVKANAGNKETSQIITRKTLDRNLRSNKSKEAPKSIRDEAIEVRESADHPNKDHNKQAPKEPKAMVPEEPQRKTLIEVQSYREERQAPAVTHAEPADRPRQPAESPSTELVPVRPSLKQGTHSNNSLHEAIAKFIKTKKEKVRWWSER